MASKTVDLVTQFSRYFSHVYFSLASTRFYRQLFKSDHKMGGIHGVAEAIQGLIACVGSLLVATAALFSEKDTTKRPTSGQTPQSSPIRRTKSLPVSLDFLFPHIIKSSSLLSFFLTVSLFFRPLLISVMCWFEYNFFSCNF